MSEKIYALLLRLYPSGFQRDYGEEALQLFRDRVHDERGFVSSLRLWLDLLSDLAISVPRAYRTVPAAAAGYRSAGTPFFLLLEDETPSFGSLFYGTISALLAYTAILLLLVDGGRPLSIRGSDTQLSPSSSGAYSGAVARDLSSSAHDVTNRSEAIAKPTPTVSVTYTPFPPASGSTVHTTAMVSGVDGEPAPTGSVHFLDGNAVLDTGQLNNGSATVKAELPNLGTHSLYAIYSGDGAYGSASSAGKENEASRTTVRRFGRTTGLGRSASLAMAAGVLFAAPTAGLAQTVPSPAPPPPLRIDAKPLTFEVVSIHEDKSEASLNDVTMGVTPDGFRARNVPLLSLIQGAYRPSEGSLSFRLKQIVGLPTWAIFQTRYDVDARVSEADLPAWRDPALQPEMLRSMVQAMLADRFKLAVHRENKVVPVYDLTVGNRGPKLTPYNGATLADIQQKHPGAHPLAGDAVFATGPNPGQQWFFGVTVSQLGTLLSNLAGRPVLDKTGLKGRYDVTYQIELLPPPPPPTDGVAPPPPSPDADFFRSQISTIVEDQLGLKLKAGTGPVESLVIDHVEQLSEN